MYAKEPVPQMVLSSNGVTLPPDRITALLAGWSKAREARATAFLNADIKLDKLSIDPKSLQLNEARQYVALELCRTAGLPAYFASAELMTMTYTNAISERRSLVDFGLRNLLTVIEQTLTLPAYTASTTEVKFDMDDFLRGNPLERAQVYQILNGMTDKDGNPAMTIGEIRKSEDMLL
jgi:HK97 family phage portal protein